jgi:hypothetical protein
MPKPTPVSAVKRGWAKGDITIRTKKVVAVVEESPPEPRAWSWP